MKNKIDTMIDSYMRYNTNLSMYFKILDKKTVLITLAEESVTTNNNFHLAFNAKDLQRIYKEELFDIAFNYSKEEIEEIISSRMETILTLQRLKHVGFLCTFTSKYTRKHIRLMSFHKTFTTKDTIVSISDSIRLVSKPIYISFN